jgi:outer membrane protein assembly factor BamB
LLIITGCAVTDTFTLDSRPLDVEIRTSPKRPGPNNEITKKTELTLPVATPASTSQVKNGLVAITGSSIENGKIRTNKNRIVMFDLISDRVLWSATGDYKVNGLYNNLLVLRKSDFTHYIGLDPTTPRQLFQVKAEPACYDGLEDVLLVSRADSVICFNADNGANKWITKGHPITWARHHYVKDRKFVIYGDYIQVIDVDSQQQWNMELSNTKVHTAEAMAINFGLCLLSSCVAGATGTYVDPGYVEARVTHSLGSLPVFTEKAVIFADATSFTMCDIENGNKIWQSTFSPDIQPSEVLLSVSDNLLLATFTGQRHTNNTLETIADPQFWLMNANTGDPVWKVQNSRIEHPRDVIWGKDNSYLLYKTELRMYDEADTLQASTNCSLEWGEFYSFEYRSDQRSMKIYCSEGILEIDPKTLQEISFTEMPAESMEAYIKKYPSYQATKHSSLSDKGIIGRDGLKAIIQQAGLNSITFTSTYEGGY